MAPDEDGAVASKPPAPATSVPSVADTDPAAASAYLDWASAMQALYGGRPATPGSTPPTLCPPSSSPSPYIWGSKSTVTHGPPISCSSLHPGGGVYSHPAMSLGSSVATRETEAKPLEGSDQGLKKVSNDGLGNVSYVIGNDGDSNKVTSGSLKADPLGNVGFSTSTYGDGDKATLHFINVDASHCCDESGSEEFLRDNRNAEINPYDECEQKRQKRKLSNRESARRSRERKQKECEDLARQVVELNTQNGDLRVEIDKLNMECKKLEVENTLIVEELKQLYGPSILVAIEGEKLGVLAIGILGVEYNGQGPERSNLVPMVHQNAILLPTSNVKAQ